jgi:hypothetical protein
MLPIGVMAETETAFDVRADLGYDSNVFDLSQSVGERPGMFSYLGAGFDVESTTPSGRRVAFDTAAAAQLFEADVEDGDLLRYHLRLSGDSGGNRDEHEFDWALRYRQRDSTYVSRFTGSVADDGAGTKSRPLRQRGDLRIGWRLPERDFGRVSFAGSLVSKDYENDYAALGLERLDYEHFAIMPEYELRDRATRVRIGASVAVRKYVDRRMKDINGILLSGTDLQYRYYGVEGSFDRELTPTQAIEISGSYENLRITGTDTMIARWDLGFAWIRPRITRLSVSCSAAPEHARSSPASPRLTPSPPRKTGMSSSSTTAGHWPGAASCSLKPSGSPTTTRASRASLTIA